MLLRFWLQALLSSATCRHSCGFVGRPQHLQPHRSCPDCCLQASPSSATCRQPMPQLWPWQPPSSCTISRTCCSSCAGPPSCMACCMRRWPSTLQVSWNGTRRFIVVLQAEAQWWGTAWGVSGLLGLCLSYPQAQPSAAEQLSRDCLGSVAQALCTVWHLAGGVSLARWSRGTAVTVECRASAWWCRCACAAQCKLGTASDAQALHF